MVPHLATFAVFAASAVATNPFNPLIVGLPAHAVLPRQTDPSGGKARPTGNPFGGGLDQCAKDLFGLMGSAPLPPRDIMRWMMEYGMTATAGAFPAIPTDSCPPFVKDIPGSLASEWTSYQSDVGSWYSDHSAEVSSALAACPSNVMASLPSIGPCTVTPTAIAGGGGPGDASDDDDAGGASSSSSGSRLGSRPSAAPTAGSSRPSSAGSGGGSGASELNVVVAAAGAVGVAFVVGVALH